MNEDESLSGLGDTLTAVLRSMGVGSLADLRRFGAFSVFPVAQDLRPSLAPKNLWLLLALEKGMRAGGLSSVERSRALRRWKEDKAALLWQSRCLFLGLWPNDFQSIRGLPPPTKWPFCPENEVSASAWESTGEFGWARDCKPVGDSSLAPSVQTPDRACDRRRIGPQSRSGRLATDEPNWGQRRQKRRLDADDAVFSLLPIASPWQEAKALLGDRCVSFHEQAMEEALRRAKIAAQNGAPPIGAVVTQKGRMVSAAGNEAGGLNRHAEVIAIEKAMMALGDDKLVDCELHVTLEPCLMCCGEIFRTRLRRVFVGAVSPKTGAAVSRSALAFHPQFNPHARFLIGVAPDRSSRLLTEFFNGKRG